MDIDDLLNDVRDLTDLELAVLLSLIAQQHCLITTEESRIDDLSSELALIASEVFGLSYAVVSRDDTQSIETFTEAILDQTRSQTTVDYEAPPADHLPHSHLAAVNVRAASQSPSRSGPAELDTRAVTNILIAKDFNNAHQDVQVAALELITRRRIYDRATIHQVPKQFLFIPIVSTSSISTRLVDHLNDRISISHFHDPEDGFVNLEALAKMTEDGRSERSVNSKQSLRTSEIRQIHPSSIKKLRELGNAVKTTPEVRRYIQDLVVFLRIARGVDGGVTPFATTQLVNLTKYLAPLHGINFVTPALVALALRKVYTHRLVIASPDRERSMQWGSSLPAVKKVLGDLTPEIIIEEILSQVPSPL